MSARPIAEHTGDTPLSTLTGVEPAAPSAAPAAERKGRGARRRSWFRRWAWRLAPYGFLVVLVGIVAGLLLLDRVIVIIRTGEAGALYRLFLGGTVTDRVYGEGIHFVQPWNKLFVYNTRIQTTLHDFTVLTERGLPITLKLAIRYHPEYEMVALLHQRVGPDYITTIVVPQIESVMRRNIGQQTPEDIYTNKEGVLTRIIDLAIEETGQKFVFIDDIVIRAVELPPDVRAAIEHKLVEQQRFQTYEFRLELERREAERKVIEAEGVRDYQRIVSETLSPDLIRWQGVQATLSLAESTNAKVVVIGGGDGGLPVILGDGALSTPPAASGPATEPETAAVSGLDATPLPRGQ